MKIFYRTYPQSNMQSANHGCKISFFKDCISITEYVEGTGELYFYKIFSSGDIEDIILAHPLSQISASNLITQK